LWENFKGGNLGSFPVIVGLTIIVIVFSLTAQNFFTPVNLNNIITQMAGTTMLAYGVVFVLLLGEIDLSIAYLSGIAGLVAAELQKPDSGHFLPGIWPIVIALLAAVAIGAFQGSFVALIGVPAFVVTLAGLLAWQGVIQVGLGPGGPIIIENRWINYTESYFFSDGAGWLIAALLSVAYVGGSAASIINQRRHGVTIRYPHVVAARTIAIPAAAFLVVAICNKDRGLPLAGLGDHRVPALLDLRRAADDLRPPCLRRRRQRRGCPARGYQRAAHSDPRLHDLRTDGRSGRDLARCECPVGRSEPGRRHPPSRCDLGGRHRGTSLFGGRGTVRSAVLGAAVISTISNGLFIFAFQPGVIYITTGCILLFAVTLDTIARRRQAKTGR